MASKLRRQVSKYSKLASTKPALFVLAFAIIGVSVLLLSRAAGPFAALEPENTTLSGVSKVSDANASGGSYLQFGSGDTAPPPTTGFPNENNTGYKHTGVTLQDCAYTGSSSTSSPGQINKADGTVIQLSDGAVVEGCRINTNLRIYRSNVTIKKSYVYYKGCGGFVVDLKHKEGARNLRVEDTEIHGEGITCADKNGVNRFMPPGAGIGSVNDGKDYSCVRCNIHGTTDGAKAAHNVLIQDSYIWGLPSGWTPSGITNHRDTIQNSGGGSNVRIIGNTLKGPFQTSTSAIIAQTNVGPIDKLIIENNYLYGGSYSVYMQDKDTGNGPPSNSTFKNNVIEKGTTGIYRVSCVEKGKGLECANWGNHLNIHSAVSVSGNKWHDGSSIVGHP